MTSEGLGEGFKVDSADMCAGKFPLMSIGGRANGQACAVFGHNAIFTCANPLFSLLLDELLYSPVHVIQIFCLLIIKMLGLYCILWLSYEEEYDLRFLFWITLSYSLYLFLMSMHPLCLMMYNSSVTPVLHIDGDTQVYQSLQAKPRLKSSLN